MLIINYTSFTFLSIFANRSYIEELDIVFISYKEDTILLLLSTQLLSKIIGPKFGVIGPVALPFFQAIRISNLYQSEGLSSLRYFVS